MEKYGCVVLRHEYNKEVEVPSSMIKNKGDYFALQASRDGEIIPGILRGDNLIFVKSDSFIQKGYYLYETSSTDFSVAFFVNTSRDLLSHTKAIMYDPRKQRLLALCTGMIRVLFSEQD